MEDPTPGADSPTGLSNETREERELRVSWALLPPCPPWPDLN